MSYTIRRRMRLKDGTRLEPNERFDGDLPGWLVEQGHAVPVPKKKTAKKTTAGKVDG